MFIIIKYRLYEYIYKYLYIEYYITHRRRASIKRVVKYVKFTYLLIYMQSLWGDGSEEGQIHNR